MAEVKISELPAASALTGADLAPVVQAGATKKSTFTQIATFVRSLVTKADVGLGNVNNVAAPTANGLYKNIHISDSPADRKTVLVATEGWEGSSVGEGSGWFEAGDWYILYVGGTDIAAPAIGIATATNPLGPYTKYVGNPIIGNGAAGIANGAMHSFVLRVGANLYCYFVDDSDLDSWKVATATVADPLTWTAQGVAFSTPAGVELAGNISVMADGGGYTAFFEASDNESGESWQIGYATASSPLGPFTVQNFPTYSLWPYNTASAAVANGASYASINHAFEPQSGEYFITYHSAPFGSGFLDIYGAVSTDKENFTLVNNGYPIVRRRLSDEITAVGDSFFINGSQGMWAFWTAAGTDSTVAKIVASPVLSQLDRPAADANSPPVIAPASISYDQGFNTYQWPIIGNYTGVNLDDLPVDATAGPITITLPAAAVGSRLRISHIGTGANLVSIVAANTDVITSGALTLAAGRSVDIFCKVTGRWIVSKSEAVTGGLSGTYTPILTVEANITGTPTAFAAQYMRVGNVVTVSGWFQADPTNPTTLTQLGISLPIASNLADGSQCSGVAAGPNVPGGISVAIYADAANNRARAQWYPTDDSDQVYVFTFTYLVI